MIIKPTSDFVFLKPHKEEGETEGGILIPTEAEKETVLAEVTHVGPGAETPEGTIFEVPCKVGDTVIYNESGFVNKVNLFGDEYLVVRGLEIIAVVEGFEGKKSSKMTLDEAVEEVKKALTEDWEGWGWKDHPETEYAYYATHELGVVLVKFMRAHLIVQFSGIDTGFERDMSFEALRDSVEAGDLAERINDIMDIVLDHSED